MTEQGYLAIDLGAESGRMMLGTLLNGKIGLREIHRFPNGMVCLLEKYHWNIAQIYLEILKGLENCAKENIEILSIGIDTWGVDYGLLDAAGNLLGLPFAYRDSRTQNAIEEFSAIVPKSEIYGLTGTLFAPYNTLFQLYAGSKSQPAQLSAAHHLLFIPDLLAYMLTGQMATDVSFASTSQLYNPKSGQWEVRLFDALGIPVGLMPRIVEPGTVVGRLHETVCRATGLGPVPVVAVASHDTNSAIAAIPAAGNNWAFISSGTWSLMGFESLEPVISERSFALNFTNEGGVGRTFDVLKNLMGLWLLQQCRKSWGHLQFDYAGLVAEAAVAPPFTAFIDIDDASFLNPADMPTAIVAYCRESGQTALLPRAQMVRVILEGIAFKYRQTFDEIALLRGRPVEVVYITGGGIRNQLLCQFTANACGVAVKTALAEGSATGNLLTQAMGLGQLSTLADIREVAAASCDTVTYLPQDVTTWDNAYKRYQSVLRK